MLGRWTHKPSVILHGVEGEDDAVAGEQGEPHEDIAVHDLVVLGEDNEDHAEAAEHEQHYRIEEAKGQREDVLVNDGRDEEGHQRRI